jgi:hypothetical protein
MFSTVSSAKLACATAAAARSWLCDHVILELFYGGPYAVHGYLW